jgi:prepilin-type processing-associated H-X9-DG protein
MKQIGLALHNYNDSYKLMPTYVYDSNPLCGVNAWMAMILPYMEQSSLYESINFDHAITAHPVMNTGSCFTSALRANKTAVQKTIAAYSCPSDVNQSGKKFEFATLDPRGESQLSNYAGVMGSPYAFPYVLQGTFAYFDGNWAGTAPTPKQRPLKSFVDGTAKTIFAVERKAAQWASNFWMGSTWFNSTQLSFTGNWIAGDVLVNAPVVTLLYGINPPASFVLAGPQPLYAYHWSASFHPGGVNALMTDGSVQFLQNSIDKQLLWSSVSIDQNDLATL